MMYHSIVFGNKNTWTDWHLIPTSRPVFGPPQVKSNIIDIPGADGALDLSETLTKRPLYQNREGSFEFIVMNDMIDDVHHWDSWTDAYQTIMNYIHGRRMIAVMEDDPSFYYEGRFSVNDWKSDKSWSTITIDYNVNPYKIRLESTTGSFLSNPFNVESIYGTKAGDTRYINIPLSGTIGYVSPSEKDALIMPVCPTFTVSTASKSGARITFRNVELGINETKTVPDGTSTFPELVLSKIKPTNPCMINYQTANTSDTGTLTIDFRGGML